MDIVFAFYPLFVTYNHGIALLSALCKQAGIIPGLYVLDNLKAWRAFLEQNPAPTVGFSCVVEDDYILSLPFMQAAAEAGREVLLGGVYPRRKHLDPPVGVDWLCRGEGELLPQYLQVDNLHIFIRTHYEKDLNKLPLPDYELFRNIPFDRDFPVARGRQVLPYSSSRGCPYGCVFCEIRHQPQGVRIRTKVKEDLEEIVGRYQPEIIYFMDETLPYYDAAWRESWGNFQYPFIAYIRADIPKNLLYWLHSRGMIGAMFGVESGNEQYRNEVLQKGLKDDDLWRTVKLCQELDIEYAAFFMHGCPGETWEMQGETARMMGRIGGFPLLYQYRPL